MNTVLKAISMIALEGGLATISAQANSITLTETSAVGSGPSTWTYVATFVNSTVRPGDFVSINDFGPATVITGLPAGWVFSQALTGPNSVSVPDGPATLNATWTWTGATTVMSPNPSTAVTLTFVLHSPGSAGTTLALYTSKDHVTSGPVAGLESDVVGYTSIPNDPPPVPDASQTLALLGLATAGLAGFRRSLKKC